MDRTISGSTLARGLITGITPVVPSFADAIGGTHLGSIRCRTRRSNLSLSASGKGFTGAT